MICKYLLDEIFLKKKPRIISNILIWVVNRFGKSEIFLVSFLPLIKSIKNEESNTFIHTPSFFLKSFLFSAFILSKSSSIPAPSSSLSIPKKSLSFLVFFFDKILLNSSEKLSSSSLLSTKIPYTSSMIEIVFVPIKSVYVYVYIYFSLGKGISRDYLSGL